MVRAEVDKESGKIRAKNFVTLMTKCTIPDEEKRLDEYDEVQRWQIYLERTFLHASGVNDDALDYDEFKVFLESAVGFGRYDATRDDIEGFMEKVLKGKDEIKTEDFKQLISRNKNF